MPCLSALLPCARCLVKSRLYMFQHVVTFSRPQGCGTSLLQLHPLLHPRRPHQPHLLTERVLLIPLVLSYNVCARPLDSSKNHSSPASTALTLTGSSTSSLSSIAGYAFNWAPVIIGNPFEAAVSTKGVNANLLGGLFGGSEGSHLPFGFTGPLGGWAWGENKISVVVRVSI